VPVRAAVVILLLRPRRSARYSSASASMAAFARDAEAEFGRDLLHSFPTSLERLSDGFINGGQLRPAERLPGFLRPGEAGMDPLLDHRTLAYGIPAGR